jgi:transcriptional regulator with GAF, ATPase, and Fis domain
MADSTPIADRSSDETLKQINDFNESLNQTGHQIDELQAVLGRTIQALSKRGIQIQIDFVKMLTSVKQQLEHSQKMSSITARRLIQFQELVATSALLTSSLEFEQVMEKVLDTVINLTGAERVFLMLKQGEDEDLKVHIARNSQHQTLTSEDVTFSRGVLQTVIDAKTPLITTNAQNDERFTAMRSVFVNDLRSIIIVPLFLKEHLIGVLYADNRIEQGVFSQDMTPILAAFANQAAIAISNARLFEKISTELKEAQHQVQELLVRIDHDKVRQEVSQITSTDYFQRIASRAAEIRERAQARPRPPADANPDTSTSS